MPRSDIWKDGIKSRCSWDNQPVNRSRKKGQLNRVTINRVVLDLLCELALLDEQHSQEARNARRREWYAQKKPGEPP